MPIFLFLLPFFVVGCDPDKRYVYYSGPEYRAVIKKIRDVEVNNAFDVRATIEDRDGDRLRESIEVELILTGGSRSADLRGRTERDARSGRVIFSNLRIDRAGRDYRVKLIFSVDGEEFYSRSNKFDVIDDDYYDDDDDDGISIGGSLFSLDMKGLPDNIVAGQALPDLTFTMKMLGNKSTGGTVTLKVKDEHGDTLDDALMVWRKPSLSANVKSGKAVFSEAFFTQKMAEGADLVAKAVRVVGTKTFALPRVRSAAVDLNVHRLSTNAGHTELHGSVRVEGMPCSNCAFYSYLVSNERVKDATATTTDDTGSFSATIPEWSCTTGVDYRGAVKVLRARSNHYALIRTNCN